MPQYAIYDSALSGIVPVTGWYDSENFPLMSPPAAANLLELTSAQWNERMTGEWAVSAGALVVYTPPAPAPPTLAQQAVALIAGGITITSAGTPGLNGVYSTGAVAQQNIQATQIYIQANGKFPGSSGTMVWADKSGGLHVFPSIAEFTAFATAVYDFVADCTLVAMTNSGTLPAAAAAIP